MNDYITVFRLNQYIKGKFDSDESLQNVYIKGEISNYRPHPSGHMYFTLKDENAAVSAIMFASSAKKLNFKAENGMKVLVRAHVSVYPKTGVYQLYVSEMTQDGIGNLYAQFEALRKKLQAEGLFDESHKKAIPHYPGAIAVLSAKSGAALQDTLRTIHMRFPVAKVFIFPVPVQGIDAYKHIIATLKGVDRIGFPVVLLVRGGGSIEDLWNFNEEALVRAIYEMKTPIITGVGHETDFTLVDFVSDLRAATPTAAAVAATPNEIEMREDIHMHRDRLNQVIMMRVKLEREHLDRALHHYIMKNPEHLYENEWMRLNNAKDHLAHFGKQFVSTQSQEIETRVRQMDYAMQARMKSARYDLSKKAEKLDLVSPLKILSRGYAIVKKEETVVESINALKTNDQVTIQLQDGTKEAIIK